MIRVDTRHQGVGLTANEHYDDPGRVSHRANENGWYDHCGPFVKVLAVLELGLGSVAATSGHVETELRG